LAGNYLILQGLVINGNIRLRLDSKCYSKVSNAATVVCRDQKTHTTFNIWDFEDYNGLKLNRRKFLTLVWRCSGNPKGSSRFELVAQRCTGLLPGEGR